MVAKVTCMVVLSLCCTLATGCGGGDFPPLGEVTGVVTLDGKPLQEAMIVFRPASGGRPSEAVTDAEGRYRMMYRRFPDEVYGCKVGEQQVVITTYRDEDDPGGPTAELVPKCYRGRQNALTASVVEGDNTIDFSLTSDCSDVN